MKSSQPSTLHAQLGEIGVSVRSECPGVLEDFADLYRDRIVAEDDTAGTMSIDIRRTNRRWLHRRRYDVWGDSGLLFGGLRRRELLPYLEWGISRSVMASRPDFLQLHAATMSRDDCGIIFPAQSGVGKSTLAAALLSHGWTYLCDEFALINPRSLRVHPFLRAVCIKAGSFDMVERLPVRFRSERYHVDALGEQVGFVSAAPSVVGAVANPVPVRFIVFPSYERGGTPKLLPISPARAVFALSSLTMNRDAYADRCPAILAALARNAKCFRLITGRPEAMFPLLDQLVSESQSA